MDSNPNRSVVPGALILLGMVGIGLGAGWLARNRLATPRVDPDPHTTHAATNSLPTEHESHPRFAAQQCGDPGTPMPGRATEGGAVAVSPMQDQVAVVDADRNVLEILAVAPEGLQRVRSVRTGIAPTQAVFSTDGRVFVTERGEHRVSVYRASTGERVCTTTVADEPIGIAIAPDERSVFVTSGAGQALTKLDTTTFEERFRVDPGRAPRGVTISADGRRAFVAHVAGDPLTAFDLGETSAEPHRLPTLPVPGERGTGFAMPISAVGVGIRSRESMAVDTTAAVAPSTGAVPLPSQAHAVVFDPQRQRVIVPFMVNRTGREVPAVARLDFYGAGSVDPQTQSEKVTFALAVFDMAQERWERVDVRTSATRFRGSGSIDGIGFGHGVAIGSPTFAAGIHPDTVRIPSAAVLSPDGNQLVVASTGTDHVVSFAIDRPAVVANAAATTSGAIRRTREAESAAAAPMTTPTVTPPPAPFATVDAPSGLAVLRDGRRIVWSLLDHAVEVHDANTTTPGTRIVLGDDPLPPDVSRGRRLFLAADDARLSSGGLSCGGCHPDGGDDGLVWFLQRGPRQTPTLPGRLTPPFNWNGSAWTMEENVAQTVRRLGGTGLPMNDVDALSAYVNRGLRMIDHAHHALSEQERRGQELFSGAAACSTCHDPLRNFTDGQPHELGGLGPDETEHRFDTPSLRFVGATAPYFHDGRYATLEAMLRDPTHRMGRVDQLTPGDVDALSAYLRTL